MSFFADLSTTFNEIADATFNTLIFHATKQSNEVGEEYAKLLANPNFRTTREVKKILLMDAKDARKEFGINIDDNKPEAKQEAKPAPKKSRTRKSAPKPEASN